MPSSSLASHHIAVGPNTKTHNRWPHSSTAALASAIVAATLLMGPTASSSSSFANLATMASANDYVRCGTGPNSLCISDYPICCNGYCASAGTKCCSNDNTCDPGQECCTAYDDDDNPSSTCCDPGSYCGDRGCVQNVCASITDPGVCVSQYNATMNMTAENSLCSWCCASQVCVPTAVATETCGAAAQTVSNPWGLCKDPCALHGTCDSCTLANTCLWDSGSQRCFTYVNHQQYNPYAVVSSPDECSTILYWGTGISPADGPLSIFGDYGRVFIIIFAVLFALCLVAICVAGARVAMLVNRSHQDWEDARDSAALSISAAVPRYGFAADESTAAAGEEGGTNKNGSTRKNAKKKGANEKNFRTPLLSRVDGADGGSSDVERLNNNAAGAKNNNSGGASSSALDAADDTLCHVCHRDMEHDSRRRFVPLSNAAVTNSNTAAAAAAAEAQREEDTVADGATSTSSTTKKKKDTVGSKKAEKEEDVTQSIATTADTWHQIVLLPCYHRVCKQCILSRAEANASAAAGWGVYSGRLLTNLKQRVMTSFAGGGSAAGSNSTETSLVILDEEGGGINANNNANNSSSKNKKGSSSAIGNGSAAVMIGGVVNSNSRSIASVLDVPDVSEEALLGVLGGMTVDSLVERTAMKSKQEAEKKRRAEQRRQRRANANNTTGGTNATNNNNASDSSSDSEDEDGGAVAGATVAGAAARRRRGGGGGSGGVGSISSGASKRAQCPVCSHEVELVFVPGKVLR